MASRGEIVNTARGARTPACCVETLLDTCCGTEATAQASARVPMRHARVRALRSGHGNELAATAHSLYLPTCGSAANSCFGTRSSHCFIPSSAGFNFSSSSTASS